MATTLRRTVDCVTALALAGLATGVGLYQWQRQREVSGVEALAHEVRRFQETIQVRAATKDVELTPRGWPATIDPSWFDADPPRNRLVTPNRPWVEVAPPQDADLQDPLVRVALDGGLASFWYNPYQGIVRARVPLKISDELTLKLYNAANGTDLDCIYTEFVPPQAAVPEVALPATPEPIDEMSDEAMDPTRPPPPAPSNP